MRTGSWSQGRDRDGSTPRRNTTTSPIPWVCGSMAGALGFGQVCFGGRGGSAIGRGVETNGATCGTSPSHVRRPSMVPVARASKRVPSSGGEDSGTAARGESPQPTTPVRRMSQLPRITACRHPCTTVSLRVGSVKHDPYECTEIYSILKGHGNIELEDGVIDHSDRPVPFLILRQVEKVERLLHSCLQSVGWGSWRGRRAEKALPCQASSKTPKPRQSPAQT